MALHVETGGPDPDDDRNPASLVLAHGFTQNRRCWGRFGQILARRHRVARVDLPGHGLSGHDDADLWTAADLLVEAAPDRVVVGYSMGGRIALHAALAHRERVPGLVLVGATAGIDDGAGRAQRRSTDDALAQRLQREGLAPFLDRWLAGPLFADLAPEAAAVEARLTNRVEGLAASLRHCGTGSQAPLWDRLAELRVPVLIVVGDRDSKFEALGRRMIEAMTGTDAEMVTIPGNHAVHLESPERSAEVVSDWVDRHRRRGRDQVQGR